jgi:hypothetical protein
VECRWPEGRGKAKSCTQCREHKGRCWEGLEEPEGPRRKRKKGTGEEEKEGRPLKTKKVKVGSDKESEYAELVKAVRGIDLRKNMRWVLDELMELRELVGDDYEESEVAETEEEDERQDWIHAEEVQRLQEEGKFLMEWHRERVESGWEGKN